MAYIVGLNITAETPGKVTRVRENILTLYPYWTETQKWLHQIHHETTSAQLSKEPTNMLAFDAVLLTADKIGEGYGVHQNAECQQLRTDLLKYEDRNTGRVLLSTFYKAALEDGKWQFSESLDYLRQIGALDESDTERPSVIAANSIGAVSNCLATSSFY